MSLGGGGSTTTTFTPEKQKGLEGDVLGTGTAIYDQLLYEMGYERTPAPQRDFAAEIADLQGQAAQAQASGDKDAAKSLQSQIKALESEQKALSKQYKKYGATPFTLSKRALTPEEQQQADFEAKMKGQYQGMLGGEYSIDPESRKWLDEVFGTEMTDVQRQIDKAATQAAASRGLGLSDTPIGNPYLRTTSEAAQSIFGRKAAASLGMRSEDLARAGGYMSYFDTLKQLKRFQNPMSLGGAYSNLGLGLQSNRYKAGTTTTSGSGGFNLGGLLQGSGSALSGAAQVGQLFMS